MSERATGQDLLGWAEALSGIARTGLGFTESLYEKERYEEILKVASHIRSAVNADPDIDAVADEWMRIVGQGVSGYVTPKAAVGAVVGNEKKEILLVQRADSGVWLYPTGWADIGYSPVASTSGVSWCVCRMPLFRSKPPTASSRKRAQASPALLLRLV